MSHQNLNLYAVLLLARANKDPRLLSQILTSCLAAWQFHGLKVSGSGLLFWRRGIKKWLSWAGWHFSFLEGEVWTRKATVKLYGRTVHPPHSSMNGRHSERPPRCAAINLNSGFSGLVLWRRGSRGQLGGWVAVALLSWHCVFALYEVGGGRMEIPLRQLDRWVF